MIYVTVAGLYVKAVPSMNFLVVKKKKTLKCVFFLFAYLPLYYFNLNICPSITVAENIPPSIDCVLRQNLTGWGGGGDWQPRARPARMSACFTAAVFGW